MNVLCVVFCFLFVCFCSFLGFFLIVFFFFFSWFFLISCIGVLTETQLRIEFNLGTKQAYNEHERILEI